MKLLHFLIPALSNYFTLWGGGGSGGGGSSQTTQSQQLDPTVKPYVEYGLQEAKGLYQTQTPTYYPGQTFVSPSAQTQTALNLATQRALAGSPLTSGAIAQQTGTVGGQYLGANPYLEAALRPGQQAATQAYNQAIGGTRSQAAGAGRYGSGAQTQLESLSQQNLANALAGQAGQAAYQNYATERGLQQQAALAAPQLAQSQYADIQQLANVGKTAEGYSQAELQSAIDRYNFEQNKPYQKLAAYLGAAYGAPVGTVSQSTTQQSGGGKIVCTMMNESYGFGSYRNAVWLKHSASMPNRETYQKGYHKLFLPLVDFAKGNGVINRVVKSVLEHIARHRTSDIYLQMKGKRRDTLGRVYRAILEPICLFAGKVGK